MDILYKHSKKTLFNKGSDVHLFVDGINKGSLGLVGESTAISRSISSTLNLFRLEYLKNRELSLGSYMFCKDEDNMPCVKFLFYKNDKEDAIVELSFDVKNNETLKKYALAVAHLNKNASGVSGLKIPKEVNSLNDSKNNRLQQEILVNGTFCGIDYKILNNKEKGVKDFKESWNNVYIIINKKNISKPFYKRLLNAEDGDNYYPKEFEKLNIHNGLTFFKIYNDSIVIGTDYPIEREGEEPVFKIEKIEGEIRNAIFDITQLDKEYSQRKGNKSFGRHVI